MSAGPTPADVGFPDFPSPDLPGPPLPPGFPGRGPGRPKITPVVPPPPGSQAEAAGVAVRRFICSLQDPPSAACQAEFPGLWTPPAATPPFIPEAAPSGPAAAPPGEHPIITVGRVLVGSILRGVFQRGPLRERVVRTEGAGSVLPRTFPGPAVGGELPRYALADLGG